MTMLSRRLIVIAATLGSAVVAQNPEKPPARVAVRIVQVKMDMVNDFSDTVRTEVIPMLKKAGIPWLEVSAPVFGSMAEFTLVTPVTTFAVFNDNIVMKTLGPEQGARLIAKLTRYTDKGTFLTATAHPDLSITHEGASMPFAVVTHTDVAPTKGAEFANWIKSDLVPALRKAEVLDFDVYSTMFGAPVNHWVTILGLKDLAEIDKGSPLMRSMGQDALQSMMAKTAGIVTHVERYVTRRIPELSYGPAERASRAGQ